jgi:hypothetical protein
VGKDGRRKYQDCRNICGIEILNAAKIEGGRVVDDELLRLFLGGWDMSAFYSRSPVLPGVHP